MYNIENQESTRVLFFGCRKVKKKNLTIKKNFISFSVQVHLPDFTAFVQILEILLVTHKYYKVSFQNNWFKKNFLTRFFGAKFPPFKNRFKNNHL